MHVSSIQHVYTIHEIHEEMKALRRTFSVVRLVSPEDCHVFDTKDDILSLESSCYSIWGRSSPCEYCLSRHVIVSHSSGMKTEVVDGHFFLVFAKYVSLEGKDFSLEMVSEVTGLSDFEREKRVLDEISRLQKENSRLMRDPLTNCYSRHYLNENFRHYVREARMRGQELCVALVDMDNFKIINDIYGHATGDAVLKSCCQFWLKYFDLPGQSFLTRYGGDEFVIASRASSYKDFCIRLRLLASSMRQNIVLPDGSTIPFSFTMGCACMSEVEATEEDAVWNVLFPVVDRRMYHGKSSGRNCIVTDDGGAVGAC